MGLEPGNLDRVLGGNVIGKEFRAVGGGETLGIFQVLHGEGNTRKDPDLLACEMQG